MEYKKEVLKITATYLEDELDNHQLSKATEAFKAILEKLSEQDLNIDEGRTDLTYTNGKALGTYWAALCLDDLLRTRQFVRGIHEAIKDQLKEKKKIHILYAGTGPFATLILPIIFKYAPEQISYTFLEINPFTFKLVQKVASKIGLDSYDITFVNDDASTYQINKEQLPDIIISETMQNSLANEQQVPIYMNLMTQVDQKTVFIPEKIALHIGVKKKGIITENLKAADFHSIKNVFEVSKATFFKLNTTHKNELDQAEFSKKHHAISNENWSLFDHLVILTEIVVYKDVKIDLMDSGLTVPNLIQEFPDKLEDTLHFTTEYKISSEPHLAYQLDFKSKITNLNPTYS